VPEITRPQLAVYAAAAVAIALIGAGYLRDSAPPAPKPRAAKPSGVRVQQPGRERAHVHVAGEVRRPGVYRMRGSARVDDALRRAGGATARADLDQLNLAARVEDGRQVLVPARGAAGGGGATAGAGGVPGGGPGGAAGGQPLNLNTATAEQLDGLDGVGPSTAQKILAYRQQHGGFRSVNELDRIPGIGEKRMASLRDQVRV